MHDMELITQIRYSPLREAQFSLVMKKGKFRTSQRLFFTRLEALD